MYNIYVTENLVQMYECKDEERDGHRVKLQNSNQLHTKTTSHTDSEIIVNSLITRGWACCNFSTSDFRSNRVFMNFFLIIRRDENVITYYTAMFFFNNLFHFFPPHINLCSGASLIKYCTRNFEIAWFGQSISCENKRYSQICLPLWNYKLSRLASYLQNLICH